MYWYYWAFAALAVAATIAAVVLFAKNLPKKPETRSSPISYLYLSTKEYGRLGCSVEPSAPPISKGLLSTEI